MSNQQEVFKVTIDNQSLTVQAIPPMPIAEYAERAQEYEKLPPYCHISLVHYMGAHYVWIASDDELEVNIECSETIETWAVHPGHGVTTSKVVDKTLRLEISHTTPRYFIVEVNQLPPLILVVDPLETDIPDPSDPDVIDLSARLGSDLSEPARSKVIETTCQQACLSNKTVYVRSGIYPVDSIHLHHLKGLQLYLEMGAVFRTAISATGENAHRHGILLEDCEDVRIWGRGCIDHQGYANYAHGRNDYNHGLVSYYVTNDLCPFTTQSPLTLLRCRNVEIEGLMVRDARNFGFNLRRSDDITLRHCKIITPPASTPEYGDGFHTNSCCNVLIENCLAYCNDDCFASGHYTHYDDRDSGCHIIRRLVGWNPRANGIRLGFHTYFNQGDYLFENCDFAGFTGSGILIHPLKDAPEAGRYQRYGTVRLLGCQFESSRAKGALVDAQEVRMAELELSQCQSTTSLPLLIHGKADRNGIEKLRLSKVSPLESDKMDIVFVNQVTIDDE